MRGSEAFRVGAPWVAISIVASAEAVGRQARPGGGAQKDRGAQVEPGVVLQATEQADAPVGALGLRMPHDALCVIYVRAAGDRHC